MSLPIALAAATVGTAVSFISDHGVSLVSAAVGITAGVFAIRAGALTVKLRKLEIAAREHLIRERHEDDLPY